MTYTIEEAQRDGWKERAPEYAAFRRAVDRQIATLAGGLTADDLPDFNYADRFASGTDPQTVAIEALQASDFPFLKED